MSWPLHQADVELCNLLQHWERTWICLKNSQSECSCEFPELLIIHLGTIYLGDIYFGDILKLHFWHSERLKGGHTDTVLLKGRLSCFLVCCFLVMNHEKNMGTL